MSARPLALQARGIAPPLDLTGRVLAASIAGLFLATVAVATVPSNAHVRAPALDLVLDTTAAVVSTSLMVLAWVRYRERAESAALYQAASFAALAVAYATAVVVSVAGAQGIADATPAQTWVFASAHLGASLLLILGGTVMLHRRLRHPRYLLLLPPIAVLLIAVTAHEGRLGGEAMLITTNAADGLPVVTQLGAAVQACSSALYFGAAAVCWRVWRRGGVVMDAWVAIGLVFAAFGEIHWALFPSAHPGQTSTADVLRLAFYVALLVGIEAEARATLRHLWAANRELADLRDAAAEQAALEERSRLARELHDGLAQDLWLAKLRTAQLAAGPLPEPARALIAEAEAAIEAGLADARQAVLALRGVPSADGGFANVLERYLADYSDRFGIRVEFAQVGKGVDVDPRTQAEIMRIAREALINVRNHADATIVGVRLALGPDRIRLRVVDNGRGFEPTLVRRDRFGLASMRERACLLGGRLEIRSKPGLGTAVLLVAPVRPREVPCRSGTVAS